MIGCSNIVEESQRWVGSGMSRCASYDVFAYNACQPVSKPKIPNTYAIRHLLNFSGYGPALGCSLAIILCTYIFPFYFMYSLASSCTNKKYYSVRVVLRSLNSFWIVLCNRMIVLSWHYTSKWPLVSWYFLIILLLLIWFSRRVVNYSTSVLAPEVIVTSPQTLTDPRAGQFGRRKLALRPNDYEECEDIR